MSEFRDGEPTPKSHDMFKALTQTSVNAYATVLTAYIGNLRNILIYVKENDVNAITYSIDCSMDGTDWERLANGTDIEVAKNGTDYQTLAGEAWQWMRIQFKSTVADTHSTDTDFYIGGN